MDETHRVVIGGGGFTGLKRSQSLKRTPLHVTLLDRHLIQQRLKQPRSFNRASRAKRFRRRTAVAQVRRLRFSGIMGCLMWLFIHWLYFDQRQVHILILLQWIRTYFTGNFSARLIKGSGGEIFHESPEARWVAAEAARCRHNGHESLHAPLVAEHVAP